ncbi:MAG: hypothetical protein LBT10_08135 [Methanobrevibacter sp.]|jgi:hypothetical protein|nr:hypothetical protein [Methanobrevibacter sp.]
MTKKYTDIITVIDIENAKTDRDISILDINGINNLATNHLNDVKNNIKDLNINCQVILKMHLK